MEDQIKQIVVTAVKEGISSQWWISLLILVFSIIGSSLGGYVLAYTKKKGENFATKEDFDLLLKQTQQTAQATEEIKATISRQSLVGQSELDFRKRQLAEFYGPIYARMKSSKDLYPMWMSGKLSAVNKEIIQKFRQDNEIIAQIIVSNIHLIDGNTIPQALIDYMTSTTIWNLYTARLETPWIDNDVAQLEKAKWSTDFEDYIIIKTEELKMRLDELHQKYTIV
jgi:hypothetical protein